MENEEFNALYNHVYSEEQRYVPPKEPEVLESLERFKDRKFGIMFHWGRLLSVGHRGIVGTA